MKYQANKNSAGRTGKGILCLGLVLLQLVLAQPTAAANKDIAFLVPIISYLLAEDEQASIVAFASVNQPSTVNYTIDNDDSYSATGDPIRVTRSSAGIYRLSFEGHHFRASKVNIQISTSFSDGQCNIDKYSDSGVTVFCYDRFGNFADSSYNLLVTQTKVKSSAQFIAYALFDQITNSDPYEANPNFAYPTDQNHTPSIDRVVRGQYTVSFAAGSVTNSNIQISTMTVGRHCNVNSSNSTNVSVKCYSANGQQGDAVFMIALARETNDVNNDVTTIGFATSSLSTANQYTPLDSLSFNAKGRQNLASSNSTGSYSMEFPGHDLTHSASTNYGIPLISADSNNTCSISYFSATTVSVNCTDLDDEPVDAIYSILFIRAKKAR